MLAPDLSRRRWRKSSYSNGTGACVEMTQGSGWTAIRDSKHPTGPALIVTKTQWAQFLTAVRNRFSR
ncbi:transcriptional regulator [Longimycelium tulufanense]|uniref:Transcriptional regulator n=1 Tax=Longimycelium tulufanense TaxID=907463 RepID=A0A8J3CGX8_9PSEU|nr:DUF397 domain-containing protein [Longimycelium tulufanense]GGM73718.1 transcriptional regulator [Longimycelium tulufanense]